MKALNIRANFGGKTALDRLARAIALELLRRRVRVGAVDIGTDANVMAPFRLLTENLAYRSLYIGPLDATSPAPYDAVYVPWEADWVPVGLRNKLNACRHVIVPTQWQARVFKRSGVKAPVSVVRHGVDPLVYARAQTLPRAGTFMTAGRRKHGVRKGIDATIMAFKLAFGDDPSKLLIVKLLVNDDMPSVCGGNVVVLREEATPERMRMLYSTAQAFVTASSGEGWGLHVHEAMACGRPAIAAVFGGLTEYVKPGRNAYGVPFMVEQTANPALYGAKAQWAVPSLLHMAELMRVVAAEPVEALVRGVQASLDVAPLTVERMVDGLVEVLDE